MQNQWAVRSLSSRAAGEVRLRTAVQSNQHRNGEQTRLRKPRQATRRPEPQKEDMIEDAIALGNSARDSNPPRYEDAERAYKLAAKLEPEIRAAVT